MAHRRACPSANRMLRQPHAERGSSFAGGAGGEAGVEPRCMHWIAPGWRTGHALPQACDRRDVRDFSGIGRRFRAVRGGEGGWPMSRCSAKWGWPVLEFGSKGGPLVGRPGVDQAIAGPRRRSESEALQETSQNVMFLAWRLRSISCGPSPASSQDCSRRDKLPKRA